MSECDKFPAGSRQRDACEGRCYSLDKTNKFRSHHGLEPISDVVWAARSSGASSQTIRYIPTTAIASTLVSGQGGRSCCGSGAAPVQKKSFIEKSKERLANLASAAVDFWQDGMAVATDEQQQDRLSVCAGCPLNVNGWCDLDQGGCGCNISLKVKARAAYCPQGKWFAQHDTYQPLVNPVRNLIFHLYPKIGAEWNWHWHIENIRRVAHLFNGKICIGIATGEKLAKPDVVQQLLDGVPVSDWIVRKNTPKLGETTTFTDLLRCVETDDANTITFRGHTKGVTHRKEGIEQPWARMMWATSMDLASVDDALASHVMAGPLKCHEPLVSKQPYRWFYAGTFYWFRNREIFQRNWQHTEATRWFSEYWPGLIAKNEESACLCHDFTDGSVLSEEYWRTVVDPSFEAWKHARPDRMIELE